MAELTLEQTIRDAYAAYSRGDIEALLPLLDEDFELRPPPTSPDPEPLRGHEGAREYMLPNLFEAQSAEPLEIVEEGDRVLVVARVQARGRESGIELNETIFHLWHLDPARERVVRFEVFLDHEQALAALRG